MGESLKYVIFPTQWGYFGLLGSEKGLVRTSAPIADSQRVKQQLLSGIVRAESDTRFFAELGEKVKAYFEGSYVDFADTRVVLDSLSEFSKKVLTACRKIQYGRTISYGRLAKLAHRPGAGRAVGNVLAKNPVPLIVPCHRVIRKDGKVGGFSAAGGIRLKQKMLELERPF